MMGRIAVLAVLLCGLLVADADAQILGRIFGRGGNCSSGSCSSGSSYAGASRVAAAGGVCTSGLCAAPVSADPGFVQIAPAVHENQLTADSNHGLSWDVSPERTVAVKAKAPNSLVSAYYSDVLLGKRKTTIGPSQVIARR